MLDSLKNRSLICPNPNLNCDARGLYNSRLQSRESDSGRRACNVSSRCNIVKIYVKLRTDVRIRPEIFYVDTSTGHIVLTRRSSDIFELRFWSHQKILSELGNDLLPQGWNCCTFRRVPNIWCHVQPFCKNTNYEAPRYRVSF